MRRLEPTFVEPIIEQMKQRYDVRVRRWRSTMTGCAWSNLYLSGQRINWIESPYPRTPISLSIFLHEIGHHAIGFDCFKRRCEEEYHVWRWAMATMRSLNVEPDERTQRRVDLSIRYAVDKAMRRGLRNLPEALAEYATAA